MNIAVFYHAIFSGPHIPSPDLANDVVQSQLGGLVKSGLAERAQEIHVGITRPVLYSIPDLGTRARLHEWEPNEEGEYPTLRFLQQWLKGRNGWAVCYFHSKGLTHPTDGFRNWRNCMQRIVVDYWDRCYQDIRGGYDTSGIHWICQNGLDWHWAGNFWWASSDFLSTLPELKKGSTSGKYYPGEIWLGKGPGQPRVRDYANHPWLIGC